MRSPRANALSPRVHAPAATVAPGLGVLVAIAIAATAIASRSSSLSPLVVGIVLGAIVANVASLPPVMTPGVTFGARSLLRVGVVLLGLRLSLGDLVGLGANGLVVVAATVAVTFGGTRWLARRLGIGHDLGLLVATGYSICGASAIAAMDSVVGADEEETAYAITLVTLCGTLSIFVLPLLADVIGLTGEAFGTWVGGAVHDVGQVVATASTGEPAALEAATVVKLTRVVLLAPLVALIALRRRRIGTLEPMPSRRPPLLPLFVVGFLAAIVVRSAGVLERGVLDAASLVEKAVLTVALVALGLGVRVDRMRRLGGRPLVLGLLAWVLVAGTAYAGTALVT